VSKTVRGPDTRRRSADVKNLRFLARRFVSCIDPAASLIDQLKEVYIDGVLETVDTTQWYPKIMCRDYTVGFNVTESGIDDPD